MLGRSGSWVRLWSVLVELEELVELGERQEQANLIVRAPEPNGLLPARGVPTQHDQGAQPRRVDYPGGGHVNHEGARAFRHLAQQLDRGPPKLPAGFEIQVRRSGEGALVVWHARSLQRGCRGSKGTADDQTFVTLAACSPFGPSRTSNSTWSFSFSDRKPSAWMAE